MDFCRFRSSNQPLQPNVSLYADDLLLLSQKQGPQCLLLYCCSICSIFQMQRNPFHKDECRKTCSFSLTTSNHLFRIFFQWWHRRRMLQRSIYSQHSGIIWVVKEKKKSYPKSFFPRCTAVYMLVIIFLIVHRQMLIQSVQLVGNEAAHHTSQLWNLKQNIRSHDTRTISNTDLKRWRKVKNELPAVFM